MAKNSLNMTGTFSKDPRAWGFEPELMVTMAAGSTVDLSDGRYYLDWVSGLGTNLFGYGYFKKKQILDPAAQLVSSRGGAVEGAILTEAIVVLDLCNSTAIAAKYGDNFALNLMKNLDRAVTQIARKERYQFIKNTGDGFLLTFSKTVNAVQFALRTMNNINKYNAKADNTKRINLRFGINLGETRVKEKGDRLGIAINMAFRIEGVKPEGLISIENGMSPEEMPLDNRILISENVDNEIQNMAGVKTKLGGFFELKGITGLHKVYELTSAN